MFIISSPLFYTCIISRNIHFPFFEYYEKPLYFYRLLQNTSFYQRNVQSKAVKSGLFPPFVSVDFELT